ncbi:MAG TPA: ROK family glucokinase [Kineosporiaceae bacterium]|nr:ROK family glucokinase [Kineosporiaceae bacterium]
MELTIGVDVGGTKIAAGVVDADGGIIEKIRISTPAATAQSVEDGIVEAVLQLSSGHPVSAVGVAAPGFVDAQRTTLRFTPNLPMADRPLRALLQPRIGLPVVVENDASAAAWGEYRFGGGRGVTDVVLLTVGTGLGGGIVLDGRLLRGAFGIAGEFGHVRIVPGGLPCGCGNRGCWEQYTSGSALIRQAHALARTDAVRAARLLELAGGTVEAIAGGMITQAAREGDPAAIELLAELGRWLGEGIADIADVLDPAVVVIGGGVSEAGDLLLEPARKAFTASLSAGVHRPHLVIREAELGNDAGLIGAADLARVL